MYRMEMMMTAKRPAKSAFISGIISGTLSALESFNTFIIIPFNAFEAN